MYHTVSISSFLRSFPLLGTWTWTCTLASKLGLGLAWTWTWAWHGLGLGLEAAPLDLDTCLLIHPLACALTHSNCHHSFDPNPLHITPNSSTRTLRQTYTTHPYQPHPSSHHLTPPYSTPSCLAPRHTASPFSTYTNLCLFVSHHIASTSYILTSCVVSSYIISHHIHTTSTVPDPIQLIHPTPHPDMPAPYLDFNLL